MKTTMISLTSILVSIITVHQTVAFTVTTHTIAAPTHTTRLSSTSTPIVVEDRTIGAIKLDPLTASLPHESNQIMQLAAFRNNLESPAMTIASQQAKRDAVDPKAAAITGLRNGLAVGAVIGIATGFQALDDMTMTEAAITAFTNFLITGGVVGGLLAVNNYTGNGVYVMGEDEMINRLTVDYVASVKVGQDVGFGAYADFGEENDMETWMGGRFRGTCGMVGCVDCQLRNSEMSTAVQDNPEFEIANVPGLPPHVHLKNMEVDQRMRRRGVGMELIRAVEDWGRQSTDAEMMTLEVDEVNTGAVKLYENAGFVKDEKRRSKKIGRFFMTKSIQS